MSEKSYESSSSLLQPKRGDAISLCIRQALQVKLIENRKISGVLRKLSGGRNKPSNTERLQLKLKMLSQARVGMASDIAFSDIAFNALPSFV